MGRFLLYLVGWLALACFSSCKKSLYTPATKPPPVEAMSLIGITRDVGSNIGGYYAGLPGGYEKDGKQHPLILYIHGGGQFGNGSVDLPNLLSEGIPALLDTKAFPGTVTSNGQEYSFIVLVPQFKAYPSSIDLQNFLDFAKANYRIDLSRIYLTGFSIGGRITCDFAGEAPSGLAAIVPIAGASTFSVLEKSKNIASSKLPVWAFHNEQDELINVYETKNFIASIDAQNPSIRPLLTLFPSSTALLKHDAWTRATDPKYRENGMNIYEWMLQFKR